jgi:hypothetical protein
MTKEAKASFTIEQRSIYAITFDLDNALRGEAQRILFEEGFTLQNGGMAHRSETPTLHRNGKQKGVPCRTNVRSILKLSSAMSLSRS